MRRRVWQLALRQPGWSRPAAGRASGRRRRDPALTNVNSVLLNVISLTVRVAARHHSCVQVVFER